MKPQHLIAITISVLSSARHATLTLQRDEQLRFQPPSPVHADPPRQIHSRLTHDPVRFPPDPYPVTGLCYPLTRFRELQRVRRPTIPVKASVLELDISIALRRCLAAAIQVPSSTDNAQVIVREDF